MKFLIIGYGSMGKRHHVNLVSLYPESIISLYDPYILPYHKPEHADAAIIATPIDKHGEYISFCCNQNPQIPFLVEKPLGISSIPEPVHYRCAVGFNYRFHKQFNDIYNLSKRGELHFTAYENLLERYGSTVAGTAASHAIDMAIILLGKVKSVYLVSNGIYLRGHIVHRYGKSFYDYRIDSPVKFVRISNDIETIEPIRDDDCYIQEMESWVEYLTTGIRDERLATLQDGLQVEKVLWEIRYV